MAYELIPGLRQDHRGRTYQLARYPNGKLIEVPASEPVLSARTAASLEPIMVESQSRLTLNKFKESDETPNPEWVERAIEGKSLFCQGDVFKSLQCFQGARI